MSASSRARNNGLCGEIRDSFFVDRLTILEIAEITEEDLMRAEMDDLEEINIQSSDSDSEDGDYDTRDACVGIGSKVDKDADKKQAIVNSPVEDDSKKAEPESVAVRFVYRRENGSY
jgi:hypothetical protein